jgi:hypothetical protein
VTHLEWPISRVVDAFELRLDPSDAILVRDFVNAAHPGNLRLEVEEATLAERLRVGEEQDSAVEVIVRRRKVGR